MQQVLTEWPGEISRTPRPLATIRLPKRTVREELDRLAEVEAYRVQALADGIRCAGLTQTYAESFFSNLSDFNAHHTSATEGSLLGGVNVQPVIPALFLAKPNSFKAFRIEASGILGTTSTPTITFQLRLGETSGSAFLSGTSIGVTAAITTQSGVSNQFWKLELDLTCRTPGIGATNCTLSGAGYVMSPGGFASPFIYPIEPTTPPTATWTSTINGAVTQYLNISATWSASSASNTITMKNLRTFCLD